MYREKIRDVENFKSDEFKELKDKDEELLYGTRNSEAVRGVQNFLNEEGVRDSKGEELTVDGRYGANTANAVMNYQRANGLTVDGIVGDETWSSIYNRKKKREEGVEKSSSKNWWDTGSTEKNPDVWKTPRYAPQAESPYGEKNATTFSPVNYNMWSVPAIHKYRFGVY